ncbi:MAG: hypothetical protein J1F69_00855 [Clostridiales bacterium]|nr:hypothetical protein [Clostridiales bacterium]
MYKIALLGRDISYTKSPAVHRAISQVLGLGIEFDVTDTPYDRLTEAVNRLLRDYDGFFVTKPYKSEISRFIPDADFSVNVVRCADRSAHSTDGAGFMRALNRNFADWKNKVNAVLVLGTGGAAHAVVNALDGAGKKAYVLGRSVVNGARLAAKYNNAELYTNQSAQMIVNCTPLGINGEDALKEFCVPPMFDYAFDVVYSDSLTPFLRRTRNNGATVADGTDMLVYQAIEGDKILLRDDFDVEKVYESTAKLLRERGEIGGD